MWMSSTTDRGVVVKISRDAEVGRRCTLIRASSELGVHRRGDVVCGGADDADVEGDHPTPLQVPVSN